MSMFDSCETIGEAMRIYYKALDDKTDKEREALTKEYEAALPDVIHREMSQPLCFMSE